MLKKLVAAMVMAIATMLLIGTVPADTNQGISISANADTNNLKFGQEVTITANVSGYEKYQYHVQWMYSLDNITWKELYGETGKTFTFTYNEGNAGYYYKAKVVIDGIAQTGTKSSTQTTKKTATKSYGGSNMLTIVAWIAAIIIAAIIIYAVWKYFTNKAKIKEEAKAQVCWDNLPKEQQEGILESYRIAELAKADWKIEHAAEIAEIEEEARIRAAVRGAERAAYDNNRDRENAIREQTRALERQEEDRRLEMYRADVEERNRRAKARQAAFNYGKSQGMNNYAADQYANMIENF